MFIDSEEIEQQPFTESEQKLLFQFKQCNKQGKKAISLTALAISQNNIFQKTLD